MSFLFSGLMRRKRVAPRDRKTVYESYMRSRSANVNGRDDTPFAGLDPPTALFLFAGDCSDHHFAQRRDVFMGTNGSCRRPSLVCAGTGFQ